MTKPNIYTPEYFSKYKYTNIFIMNSTNTEVLLLNRDKPPWMGNWNGVGGKLEHDKDLTPLEGALREIEEETGIPDPATNLQLIRSVGVMEWFKVNYDASWGYEAKGQYMYVATVSDETRARYLSKMPCKFDEGVLDWKPLSWVLREDNLGVVKNIRLAMINFSKAGEDSLYKAFFNDSGEVDNVDFYQDRYAAGV